MTDQTTDGRRVQAVIVDDQPAVRTALRTILEVNGIEVVGEAGDGDAALSIAAQIMAHETDGASTTVFVMDVRMPGRDGISATAELVRRQSGAHSLPVLVLTTFDDDATLFGALRAGAAGFLLKNSPPETLQRAVRTIAAGDAVLDPGVVARVIRRFAPAAPSPTPDDIARLTEREKDILSLLAHGASNHEVAATLGIGEATAKTHVSRVIFKLGVRDRMQAAIRAHESGFAQQPRQLPRSQRCDE